jgi:hypothetical protein
MSSFADAVGNKKYLKSLISIVNDLLSLLTVASNTSEQLNFISLVPLPHELKMNIEINIRRYLLIFKFCHNLLISFTKVS